MLVVFDLDGTLLKEESIDVLEKLAGTAKISEKIGEIYYKGYITVAEKMEMRVLLLRGLDIGKVRREVTKMKLNRGVKETVNKLKRMGFKIGIVSDGNDVATKITGEKLGVDYISSNTLEVKNGKLTGRLIPRYGACKKEEAECPIDKCIFNNCKYLAVKEFCERADVELKDVVAVGDGISDMCLFMKAGISVGLNPDPRVENLVDYKIGEMRELIPLCEQKLFNRSCP